jgi:DNA repair protein RadC
MKIKDMKDYNKPREKLLKFGVESLKISELLALVISSGTRGKSSIQIGEELEKILYVDNELKLERLVNYKGLGKAKITTLLSVMEIGKRLYSKKKIRTLLTPKDIWDSMIDLRSSKKEHFVIFLLDSRSQEIKREVVSIGTLTESLVHPREVFEPAIRQSAYSIVLAHNHPSGNLEPSDSDLKVTKRLVSTGELLVITIEDHVIVTEKSFRSIDW